MELNDLKNNRDTSPLITVLIPTYNRRNFLPEALASVVNQDYQNLEIFVMNDGGEDVSDIVESFDDSRIILINGKENRGLPCRLNEALAQAQGKYVCYLGDDDLFYPHHVSTLVDALETKTDCQVAYSDLYKVYCRIEADGTRKVLSKIVEVSRDFDRFLMFYFNHALHVSIMHRRDLLDKAGPYNEKQKVLVDWDLTKRLVFFSDFHHVHEITGEFYAPMNKSDRISVRQRRDKSEYHRNVMAIRTIRPAKPWPKVDDMSVIFTSDIFDQQAGKTLGLIWRHTFYPYEVYLPIPGEDFGKVQTDMPNIVCVPVDRGCSQSRQVDAALEKCRGEYVAIVPRGYPIHEMWVEDPLYALINGRNDCQGFVLEQSSNGCWAAVVRKDALEKARRNFRHLSVRDSLAQAGCLLDRLRPDQISFQFDELLNRARSDETEGNWAVAARVYEHIAENHRNELWMKSLAAKAFYHAAEHEKALEYSREVNGQRPTVDTLLVEAKIHRELKDFDKAIELLESAESILKPGRYKWKEPSSAAR